MKSTNKYLLSLIAAVVAIIVIVSILIYALTINKRANRVPDQVPEKTADIFTPENLMADVTFNCASGISLQAAFFDGPAQAAASADMPPIPGGKLKLTFSDGRQVVLSQTISADGARYASADESIIFWDKGDEAMFDSAGQGTDICKVNRN
jgi:hypothetical protein